jgi:hypothetical protein
LRSPSGGIAGGFGAGPGESGAIDGAMGSIQGSSAPMDRQPGSADGTLGRVAAAEVAGRYACGVRLGEIDASAGESGAIDGSMESAQGSKPPMDRRPRSADGTLGRVAVAEVAERYACGARPGEVDASAGESGDPDAGNPGMDGFSRAADVTTGCVRGL